MTSSGKERGGGTRDGAYGLGTALQTGGSRAPQPTAPPRAPYNLELSTDNIRSSILLDPQHACLSKRCHSRLRHCVFHWVVPGRMCLVYSL